MSQSLSSRTATSRRARLRAKATAEPGVTAPPIQTRGLTKRYGELVAVDSLDIDVQAGEIFGLLGQNGAGKTTTILMLLGLTEPSAGRARVVGYDPTRRPLEVKRRVGYLPDSVGFYGVMTGRENLRYTARLNGLARDDAEQLISDALVKRPEVLILDEPTASIDPIGVVEILDLLRSLADERRITILLSSHLLSQVQSVCDRVGIFAAGRLIGVGTVPELARRFGETSTRIEVTLDGLGDKASTDRAQTTLAGVAGVSSVIPPERAREPWTLLAAPEAATTVRITTLAAAARAGLQLTAIREVVPSLDEIYRRALLARGLAAPGMAVA